MEIRYKLSPFPVLASYLDDYKTSYFKVEAEKKCEMGAYFIKISSQLKNKELEELIRTGRACYAHHLECAKTAYRNFFETNKSEIIIPISDKEIQGTLTVCSFIIALDDIKNFWSSDLNDDYKGQIINFKQGTPLATNDRTFEFNIEDNNDVLAKKSSIFKIIEKQSKNIGDRTIRINTEDKDKIVIMLPKNDFIRFGILNNNIKNQSILYSMVLIPALITVLDQIRTLDDSDLEEYNIGCGWFRSIKATLKNKYNIDIESNEYRGGKGQDSLELAQLLLGNPLTDALNTMLGDDNELGDNDK